MDADETCTEGWGVLGWGVAHCLRLSVLQLEAYILVSGLPCSAGLSAWLACSQQGLVCLRPLPTHCSPPAQCRARRGPRSILVPGSTVGQAIVCLFVDCTQIPKWSPLSGETGPPVPWHPLVLRQGPLYPALFLVCSRVNG